MAWKSIADLFAPAGEVALLGAPMEAGSVTPGRCDLAPGVVRRALRQQDAAFLIHQCRRDDEKIFHER